MIALHTLGRIPDLAARVHAFEARLRLLGPDAFVAALEKLIRSPARTDAMLACALSLVDAPAGLHAAALRAQLPFASRLLADAPPHQALARRGRLPEGDLSEDTKIRREVVFRPALPLSEHGDYPWGDDVFDDPAQRGSALEGRERLRMAVPDAHPLVRRQIARLTRQPSPRLIRLVVRDRATTTKDLVAIASRRPVSAAIVGELIAHASSVERVAVRTAVVSNPFTPTRIALLLVPSCRPNLRAIARANIHPYVRALAEELIT